MLTKEAVQNLQEMNDAQASEYDHVLLVDKSGSMGSASNRVKGTRWDEVKEYAIGWASKLAQIDTDGFTLITFNDSIQVTDNLKDSAAVEEVFKRQSPTSGTRLAPALQAALNKIKQGGKKGMIHVFLDGEANDPQDVINTIVNATKSMNADADLAFNFMQVGNDREATAFLQYLDDNLQGAGAKFDAVNSLNISEMSSLTPGQIMYLALND